MPHTLKFSLLPEHFAVCQFPPDSVVPEWALTGVLCSVTRTSDELSIVCEEDRIPNEIAENTLRIERGWVALKLEGPFPFSMTGVLASFLDPLALAHVPIFAVSTFNTDYVLIKHHQLDAARRALADAGHSLR